MDLKFKTPMMVQYTRIKKEYPDCLLFFRLGDFYELFLEDAKIGSRILDITLTARSKGKDGKIPMCGVPYHALDSYLNKAIKAGYKAAICEQVSDPSAGDIVEREVVRIVTPGTIVDENMLAQNSNNYILSVSLEGKGKSIAYADLSTGEFFVSEVPQPKLDHSSLVDSILQINPSEIILDPRLYDNFEFLNKLRDTKANITKHAYSHTKLDRATKHLKDFFGIKDLSVFDIDNTSESRILAASHLLEYLRYTQQDNLFHIKKITNTNESEYMKLNADVLRNLEVFHANRVNNSSENLSLVFTIDKSRTPLGARMLRKWLLKPLISKKSIESRQNVVEKFIKQHELRNKVSGKLEKINDIERILSRLGTKSGNARDLVNLSNSLRESVELVAELDAKDFEYIKKESGLGIKSVEKVNEIIDLIHQNIVEEPPVSVKEGGIIRDGINQELDDIKQSIADSQKWISELEAKERAKTKINSLKIGFNSVFGYYIEVSKVNTGLVPSSYVRKQTLVNSERYITEDLKYHEEIVLSAQERINEIEYKVFISTVESILRRASEIQSLANYVATADCLFGFSRLAQESNYVKPVMLMSKEFSTKLVEARHPVIEDTLNIGEFTPNSIELTKDSYIYLITGPNMAGKSTYIRQVALIQLLAQIGCYVPAYKAEISIVDAIYTRIGAGDALAQGLSTFMIEMIETARILNNATKKSLIILDEVGRGTSTIDGLSIARSVVEYIHNKIGAKTLFATHFHELVALDQRLKKLKNLHVKVAEKDGEIKFLHKVEAGGTDKSYGIEVAKLAGIPEEVVERAKQILEKESTDQLKLDL